MKFSFKLTGKDWIGLYLAFLIFYGIPVIAMQFVEKSIQHDPNNLTLVGYNFGLLAVMMFSILILFTPLLKRFIQNIYLDETALVYSGKIGEFVLFNVGNLLLCLVTFGIYVPWYLTKLERYILSKTTYKSINFHFNSKGLHLLGILLATWIIPLALYIAVIVKYAKGLNENIAFGIVNQIIMMIILIPYLYYGYKWMMNITYKDYLITWDTNALSSMIKILQEMVLSIITAGIYYPVAIVKIYEYFAKLTKVSRKGVKSHSFNAEFEYVSVWKTIWAQIILTIVTVGIYGAWAYCNIAKVIVDKTTLDKCEKL